MHLEQLIEQNYHKLNESDLYIWNHIRTHPDECRDISIDALSEACCVSHTTILRFAKKLGLSGFSELKVILKWQKGHSGRTSLHAQCRIISRQWNIFVRST